MYSVQRAKFSSLTLTLILPPKRYGITRFMVWGKLSPPKMCTNRNYVQLSTFLLSLRHSTLYTTLYTVCFTAYGLTVYVYTLF